MTSAAKKDELIAYALALPDDERAAFAEVLNESLDGVAIEVSPELESEIARRVEKIRSGNAVSHDAFEHLEGLKAKYGS